jgi:hypothetical protein
LVQTFNDIERQRVLISVTHDPGQFRTRPSCHHNIGKCRKENFGVASLPAGLRKMNNVVKIPKRNRAIVKKPIFSRRDNPPIADALDPDRKRVG